jgi:uncharacterized protein YndB with AHSA1/START domain
MPSTPTAAARSGHERRQRSRQRRRRGTAAAAGTSVFEVGRVRVWEPPRRLAFTWRNGNYAAHEQTEVEVVFVPANAGTLVTVTHRGLSGLRADHPARHGLQDGDFSRMIGLWWGEQMSSLRELCAGRDS